jgi:hypothetical protein
MFMRKLQESFPASSRVFSNDHAGALWVLECCEMFVNALSLG